MDAITIQSKGVDRVNKVQYKKTKLLKPKKSQWHG